MCACVWESVRESVYDKEKERVCTFKAERVRDRMSVYVNVSPVCKRKYS